MPGIRRHSIRDGAWKIVDGEVTGIVAFKPDAQDGDGNRQIPVPIAVVGNGFEVDIVIGIAIAIVVEIGDETAVVFVCVGGVAGAEDPM